MVMTGAAAMACGGARTAEPALPAEARAAIVAELDLEPAPAAALSDEALVARLLAYARRETGQALRPAAIDNRWSLAPGARDIDAEFRAARADGRVVSWLAALSPPAPPYDALRAGRPRYAALAASGGWRPMPEGAPLKDGARGAPVAALRDRLSAEGYAAPGSGDDETFDLPLEQAVRAFQAHHALAVDGVAGGETRRALNVSAAERLAQIDANLERWRWLPRPLPADRVEVDTGAQVAALFRRGEEVLRMRAIVGSPAHPTPMFAARIEAVVFNPPWNVPDSIARNELLPAETRRPGMLASMGIRWVGGRLQQRPGPNNSLGQIKFDVPNRFGVYLHDTPGKGLFANPVRAFSHGCMRLENPRALAAALLGGASISSAEIDARIAAGTTRRIPLPAAVPLFVVHRTVHPSDEGHLAFHPDIYGWDARLARSLPRD
jgi:murein L,D-transpeptidase YcbB/YkuD